MDEMVLKSGPTSAEVYVNQPLTQISVAFIQSSAGFVASSVFPNIPVQRQGDRYWTYDRGYFNRDEMQIRAPGTETAGGVYSVDSTPTYYADVWGFHHDIPDQRRANSSNPLDPDREATQLCTLKGLIKREKLWATTYFTTGVWTTDITGVSASPSGAQVLQWDNANSTPIEDVRAAITTVLESTGFKPNTLVLGRRVFDKLCDHPDIIDRVKYGQSGIGSPANIEVGDLQFLFKIPRILIMEAVENTAKEGQTNSHAFIGGKKALLCYAAPAPGLMTPTAGYTFSWTGYLGAAQDGQAISRFRMQNLKSDRVEIEMAFALAKVSADLGYFFTSIVA